MTARHEPALSSLSNDASFQVVFLSGTAEERGRQLGEHLAGQPDRALRRLEFWARFSERLLRYRFPTLTSAALGHLTRMLEEVLALPLLGADGSSLSPGVHGFMQALGDRPLADKALPSHRIALAHVSYDAANLLGSLPGMRHAPASRLGCSSLVVLPRSSRAGHLLHGRNFDLPPFGDEHAPLLCVHRPRDGLAHVSLHHGGGYTPGITATNEAGLTVGVHQNATRRTSLSGASVLRIAEELIEQCASLTEAISLLHQKKSASGWTFVISDAREGQRRH